MTQKVYGTYRKELPRLHCTACDKERAGRYFTKKMHTGISEPKCHDCKRRPDKFRVEWQDALARCLKCGKDDIKTKRLGFKETRVICESCKKTDEYRSAHYGGEW